MALEIERKFLVDAAQWQPDAARGTRYRQGYLSADPARVVRVRTAGDSAFLTVKGLTVGAVRREYEYPIPLADANEMLDRLCIASVIDKIRYRERLGAYVWEIDVFEGENAGLIVAEVELPSPHATLALLSWAGLEVTGDTRFFNSNLARHPYSQWAEAGPPHGC